MTSARSKADRSKVEKSEMAELEEEIRRLGKQRILEVPKMLEFHEWLDGKRLARRSCRVVGQSRTGKTVNCDVLSKTKNSSATRSTAYRTDCILAVPRQHVTRELFYRHVAVS